MRQPLHDQFIHFHQPSEPGQKRRSYACDSCRRKKIRCNGERPICDSCHRKRVSCVYTNKPTKVITKPKHLPSPTLDSYPVTPAKTTSTAAPVPAITPTSKTPPFDVCRAIPTLTHYSDRPSISEDLATIEGGVAALMSLPKEITIQSDIKPWLIADYFEYFHYQAPVIHRWSFLLRLHQNDLPPILLYSVYSITARFSKRPQVVIHEGFAAGKRYLEMAGKMIDQQKYNPTLETLQASIICSIACSVTGEIDKLFKYARQTMYLIRRMDLYNIAVNTTPGQVAAMSEEEAIILESARRCCISGFAVSILIKYFFDSTHPSIGYDTQKVLWFNDDRQWFGTHLNPAKLREPPADGNFVGTCYYWIAKRLFLLPELTLFARAVKRRDYGSPAELLKVAKEIARDASRDAQRITELYEMGERNYEYWQMSYYVGCIAFMHFTRFDTNIIIYNSDYFTQLDHDQHLQILRGIASAVRSLVAALDRTSVMPLEYSASWMPLYVVRMSKEFSELVQKDLYASANEEYLQLNQRLYQYIYEYHKYWNTDGFMYEE
ncbi:hypothetical protein H4R35_006631 [Dimargaris xerosporica]|nr:hypothetical protein H4R35_006631 [Dimargaris xerosporica]